MPRLALVRIVLAFQFVAFQFVFGLLLFPCRADPAANLKKYPPVCTSLESETGAVSSYVGPFDEFNQSCAPNSAIFAIYIDIRPYFSDVSRREPSGSCCPLPENALTGEHVFVRNVCPENFIVTGFKSEYDQPDDGALYSTGTSNLQYYLRCTKINLEIYSLGPPTDGWILGTGRDPLREIFSKPWNVPSKWTTRSHLPLALRYGLLRIGPFIWQRDGCIGHPWGSVLSGRKYAHCAGTDFRQLMRRSEDGLPPVPAPVFQPCREFDNPYGLSPKCIEPG